ncbi:MAG: hypothetical protein KME32_19705 [Mojavia pulchra JT2-VF2]|uniref:Uncharacterized protein n=1 Tax=Mojavia pulchra JT2-VF2 TaxID=287848 RepID=A0A951Q227_9NOST|nr:hypothetical protein [Mojavia pulchra JT2-VF2]
MKRAFFSTYFLDSPQAYPLSYKIIQSLILRRRISNQIFDIIKPHTLPHQPVTMIRENLLSKVAVARIVPMINTWVCFQTLVEKSVETIAINLHFQKVVVQ